MPDFIPFGPGAVLRLAPSEAETLKATKNYAQINNRFKPDPPPPKKKSPQTTVATHRGRELSLIPSRDFHLGRRGPESQAKCFVDLGTAGACAASEGQTYNRNRYHKTHNKC